MLLKTDKKQFMPDTTFNDFFFFFSVPIIPSLAKPQNYDLLPQLKYRLKILIFNFVN